MIARAIEAEIVRLYHTEHWPVGTIARQLRVHHGTVRRVLAQAGVPRASNAARPSMVAPYMDFISQTLAKYPTLRASRLYRMVSERGYPGGPDHFRALVSRLRPRPAGEAYLRLRTLPGEQAQIDWAHFGKLRVGTALRPLMAFVMVLSYSRQMFLRFYFDAAMSNFIRGHVDAFGCLNATPRVILYDNLKSAVLERVGDARGWPRAIRFHPTLLELAAHYHFEPRPVAVARGNEKGRVERAIRYVRDAFFAARRFRDIEDLNAQALAWCQGQAADRPCPEDRTRCVGAVFMDEQPRLLTLPPTPFPTEARLAVNVGKTPYVRFDLNDYSVPHTHVRRTLTVLASLQTVRIFDGLVVLASHPRSFDRDQQIEAPDHLAALVEYKARGRALRSQDRLQHSAPSTQALFLLAAQRGAHMGVLTRGLIQLLDSHGAGALEAAITAALAEDVAHLGAVRHFIDAHAQARHQSPPIAVALPDDPRVRSLHVRPHCLADYEYLYAEPTDESDACNQTPSRDESGSDDPQS